MKKPLTEGQLKGLEIGRKCARLSPIRIKAARDWHYSEAGVKQHKKQGIERIGTRIDEDVRVLMQEAQRARFSHLQKCSSCRTFTRQKKSTLCRNCIAAENGKFCKLCGNPAGATQTLCFKHYNEKRRK